MRPKELKILGIIIFIILILNLILFALRKINDLVFWIIIIAGAIFVYWILPKLKK